MNTFASVLLLGGVIMDRAFEVDNYPGPGQDAAILDAYEKIGGCALNAAVTLKNLGDSPVVVSMLGSDDTGRKIRDYFAALGLSQEGLKICPTGSTGYCLNIIDPSRERTFMTRRGCEQQFSTDMLSPSIGVTHIYVTGYYLINPESALQVLGAVEGLKKNGAVVFFDPGPLADHLACDVIERMTGLSNWILPNRFEADMIRARMGFTMPAEEWFRKKGCSNVVIKKGAGGADCFSPGRFFSEPGFKVSPVLDTTGAGDSFAGGLIHAVAQGKSPSEAVRFACACGALATTIEGPHGQFTPGDLTQFLLD